MTQRRMSFRALSSGSANTLVKRLMDFGLSVDRTPRPGYILISAVGEADESCADWARSDLVGVTLIEDAPV